MRAKRLSPRAIATMFAVLIVVGATCAHATVITSGCFVTNVACSLGELMFNPDASIIVGDKLFSHWVLDGTQGFSDPAQLGVIAIVGLDDQALNPGLMFLGNGQLSVDGQGIRSLSFHFDVGVLPDSPLLIKDHSMALMDVSATSTNGIIGINTALFDVLGLNGIALPQQVAIDIAQQTFNLFDSTTFDPLRGIRVSETITVLSLDPEGSVSLNTYVERFSQTVPEPASLGLVAIGLAIAGALSRRTR